MKLYEILKKIVLLGWVNHFLYGIFVKKQFKNMIFFIKF